MKRNNWSREEMMGRGEQRERGGEQREEDKRGTNHHLGSDSWGFCFKQPGLQRLINCQVLSILERTDPSGRHSNYSRELEQKRRRDEP